MKYVLLALLSLLLKYLGLLYAKLVHPSHRQSIPGEFDVISRGHT